MSQKTLVVQHLEGTGLVSSWLSDLICPPERGSQYLWEGNLYEVVQAVQYLGSGKSTIEVNLLSSVLHALYAPVEAFGLFAGLTHLPKAVKADNASPIFGFTPGRTPGLKEEPERIVFLTSKLVHVGNSNIPMFGAADASTPADIVPAMAVLDVDGHLFSCWLKNLPVLPQRGSQYLRGGNMYEVTQAIECLGSTNSGEKNQLLRLLSVMHSDPATATNMLSSMRPLDATPDPKSSLVLLGSTNLQVEPERIVYLVVKRIASVSALRSASSDAA